MIVAIRLIAFLAAIAIMCIAVVGIVGGISGHEFFRFEVWAPIAVALYLLAFLGACAERRLTK